MKASDITDFLKRMWGYVDVGPDLLPQAEAEKVIRDGVSFRGTNIVILVVAIFIASLGLNTNSTAVIIGAMLISPLMGPIIGLGLAVGVQDFTLMKRSSRNLAMAVLFSVAASCVYFLISPVNESHSELLARTSPTIYDIMIGFFGGAAGIIAIGSRVKGNVIPGVAIATALMPPLCTVGYGLATMQMNYFLGAFYLFFINSVFIGLATYLGVKFMRYKPTAFANPERAKRVRRLVYLVTVLTMIPAVYLTIQVLSSNKFTTDCRKFVDQEFAKLPDNQVLDYRAEKEHGQRILTVTLIGRPLPADSLMMAMTDKLPLYDLTNTRLNIIQSGTAAEAPDFANASSTMLRDMYQVTQMRINKQQTVIDSLQNLLAEDARHDAAGKTIAPELKILFPTVADIAITRALVATVDANRVDTVNIALVKYNAPMPRQQRVKFKEYLCARLKLPDVSLVDL